MKILHIVSSPRGEASFSIRLGNEVVRRLQTRYPGSDIKVHNLANTPFPHLEESQLTSFMTEPAKRSDAQRNAVKNSDEAIAELFDADIIVIGVPMYNFSIHSTLKAWLDHIIRAGVTFRYTLDGPEGLVHNKKLYLAISSGGVYSDGPMKSFDFTEPYLVKVFNLIGITDITTYRVEGISLPATQATAFRDAVERIAV